MADPRIDEAKCNAQAQAMKLAAKADAQRNALLADLRAEVERLRVNRRAELKGLSGSAIWAAGHGVAEKEIADRLQQIFDRYSGEAGAQ